jgi:hypothetical protein
MAEGNPAARYLFQRAIPEVQRRNLYADGPIDACLVIGQAALIWKRRRINNALIRLRHRVRIDAGLCRGV